MEKQALERPLLLDVIFSTCHIILLEREKNILL